MSPGFTQKWFRGVAAVATALVLAIPALPSTSVLAQTAQPSPVDNGIAAPARPDGQATANEVAVTVGGGWQEFSFVAVGIDARGCAPADPLGPFCSASSGSNSTFVGPPPWTFTGSATLIVTDAFTSGDVFQVFDNNVLVGTTSASSANVNCSSNPDTCKTTAGISTGTFSIGAGTHSLTIRPSAIAPSTFGGVAYFRLDTGGTGGNPTCSLTQTVTRSGTTVTISYSLTSSVAMNWAVFLVVGPVSAPIITVPLPAVATTASPTFSFPNFPVFGNVGWLTTLSTPAAGIVCSDFDLIAT